MLSTVTPAQPFIKWAGGKRAILAQILPHLGSRAGVYHEPFLGGGALFYALAPARAILSDINADLITTYTAIRDDVEQVIPLLHAHKAQHEAQHEDQYYKQVRAQRPTSAAAIAARFIYLNRTCFNGLYRVNKGGGFNVPMGRYAHPTICDAPTLLRASAALQGHEIRCAPFADVAGRARAGDLVYCDPPYVPASPTSDFTSYSAAGFTLADQVALRDMADHLRARGVQVVLSNSDTPITHDLYRTYRIVTIAAPRAINSKVSGRGMVQEILAIG